MLALPAQLGYGALFGLVFAESVGLPVPGETALLGAGVLAGAGRLALVPVILVAAAAAILGDGLGYWLGRRVGRRALLWRGPLARHRARAAEHGEAFFARHGSKTVFLGRFVPGVRVVAAVTAGASAMPWGRFVTYNVSGALAWAAAVGSLAALVGPAGAATFSTVVIAGSCAGAILLALRGRRRSVQRSLPERT